MSTRAVLLGTGTPNAEPERSGPAVAVIVDDQVYLVDLGPGIVRRAAAACQAGISALQVNRLTRAFVTHLHSDHTLGYPDLIFTPWVLERQEPLQVYGPPGIKSMTRHLRAAYQQDVEQRLHGLEPANDVGYQVQVYEIEPGPVYQDDRLLVEAFSVDHGSWPAFGFKFTTADRTIVISGDTAPSPTLIEQARGCDLLIHEVYSSKGFETHSSAWQRYHRHVHTSSHELAHIAAQVRPGLLVLYHQLYWGVSEQDLLAEISIGYDGRVVLGHDLDIC